MLIAKNNRLVSTPERKKCLYLFGGHDVYFNSEFGNLWCYRCGSIWKCDPAVVLKEEPSALDQVCSDPACGHQRCESIRAFTRPIR